MPTWAAVPGGTADPDLAPGTINIIVSVPVPLSDAALVNAVMTVTEAKTQAVLDAGFPGTGTATDAVCVAARPRREAGSGEPACSRGHAPRIVRKNKGALLTAAAALATVVRGQTSSVTQSWNCAMWCSLGTSTPPPE